MVLYRSVTSPQRVFARTPREVAEERGDSLLGSGIHIAVCVYVCGRKQRTSIRAREREGREGGGSLTKRSRGEVASRCESWRPLIHILVRVPQDETQAEGTSIIGTHWTLVPGADEKMVMCKYEASHGRGWICRVDDTVLVSSLPEGAGLNMPT